MCGQAKRSTHSLEWEFMPEKSLLAQERKCLLQEYINLSFKSRDGLSQSCLQRILKTKEQHWELPNIPKSGPALTTCSCHSVSWRTVLLCNERWPLLSQQQNFIPVLFRFFILFFWLKIFLLHMVGINIALSSFKYHFKPTFSPKNIISISVL